MITSTMLPKTIHRRATGIKRFLDSLAFALAVMFMVVYSSWAPAQVPEQRGGKLPPQQSASDMQNGSYYALVIGIDQYRPPLLSLKTAVNDAKAVAQALSQRYGFQVKLLLDGNATRANILDALSQYRRSLRDNDNLLIYYAGHGQSDPDAGKAYWLPADAESQTSSNWIIADELTTDIRVQPARHVLVISDSCYSGGLSRDAGIEVRPDDQQVFLLKMLAGKSRTLMASGGDEPVSDSGADGHSVFANAVLRALGSIDTDTFTAGDLFHNFVLRQVAGKSNQIPRYSTIRNSDDDNGDFVFTRSKPATVGRIESGGTAIPEDNSRLPTTATPGVPTANSDKAPTEWEADPNAFAQITVTAWWLPNSTWNTLVKVVSPTTHYDIKVQMAFVNITGGTLRTVQKAVAFDVGPSNFPNTYRATPAAVGNEAAVCYTARATGLAKPMRLTQVFKVQLNDSQLVYAPEREPSLEPASDAPCGDAQVIQTFKREQEEEAKEAALSNPRPANWKPIRPGNTAGTYYDPATGLMWTPKDNGSPINFYGARDYCTSLKLAGYLDWRLPLPEELQRLYDPSNTRTPNKTPVHIRSDIELSDWAVWSGEGRNYGGTDMMKWLDFRYGEAQTAPAPAVAARALCVRVN